MHGKNALCVGAGVIGRGWSVLFLQHGWHVDLWDPDPVALERARESIGRALTDLMGADAGRAMLLELSTGGDLDVLARHADYIQENAPEQLGLKQELFARLDSAAPANTPIASSTSAMRMTDIARRAGHHPGRCVVAHPINPVYVMPLVELSGGENSRAEALDAVQRVLENLGRQVLRLERPEVGFVLNRLQETLWREALHLVASGAATVEQIECAVTNGLGPRWATIGPFMVYHLAYGDAGIRGMLAQNGGNHAGWSRLPAPPLSADVAESIAAACERAAARRSPQELLAERDATILRVLHARAKTSVTHESERP